MVLGGTLGEVEYIIFFLLLLFYLFFFFWFWIFLWKLNLKNVFSWYDCDSGFKPSVIDYRFWQTYKNRVTSISNISLSIWVWFLLSVRELNDILQNENQNMLITDPRTDPRRSAFPYCLSHSINTLLDT